MGAAVSVVAIGRRYANVYVWYTNYFFHYFMSVLMAILSAYITEGNLKLAKLDPEAKRLANQEGNDADYDLQILKNRRESLMDEIIITVFWGYSLPTSYHSCSRIWRQVGRLWAIKVRPGTLNL